MGINKNLASQLLIHLLCCQSEDPYSNNRHDFDCLNPGVTFMMLSHFCSDYHDGCLNLVMNKVFGVLGPLASFFPKPCVGHFVLGRPWSWLALERLHSLYSGILTTGRRLGVYVDFKRLIEMFY